AQFTTSYASLSALIPQLQVGAKPTANLPELAAILATLAENVATALTPPPTDQEVALGLFAQANGNSAPQPFTDTYVAEFLDIESQKLTLYAKVQSAQDVVLWPEIGWLVDPAT